MGIRRISELCFFIALLIMVVIVLLEDTTFLLNLWVQSFGFYFQNIIQYSFNTDTWKQVNNTISIHIHNPYSTANEVHTEVSDKIVLLLQTVLPYGYTDRGRWDPSKETDFSPYNDMDVFNWTVISWGWWLSWSPFVG